MAGSGGTLTSQKFTTDMSGKYIDGVDIIEALNLNNIQRGILYNNERTESAVNSLRTEVSNGYVPKALKIIVGTTEHLLSSNVTITNSELNALDKASNQPQNGYFLKWSGSNTTGSAQWSEINTSTLGAIPNPATSSTSNESVLMYNSSTGTWYPGKSGIISINGLTGTVVLGGSNINMNYSQYSGTGTTYNTVTKTVQDSVNNIITPTTVTDILNALI